MISGHFGQSNRKGKFFWIRPSLAARGKYSGADLYTTTMLMNLLINCR